MRKFLFAAILLAGCANNDINKAALPETTKLGVIESVTPIQLDNSSDGGTVAGGIFGQVGGANSGGGRGAVVGSILGSVLGGTLGQEASIATKPGLEIWVKMDHEDKSVYVMQPGSAESFKIGDHVRVIHQNGSVRIEPMPTDTLEQPTKDSSK